jgi:hypothetical protein
VSSKGNALADAGKQASSEQVEVSLHASLHNRPEDADLQRVLDAWPTLPEHIRAAVLAAIGAAAEPRSM